ncbi:MAG: YitT family protein, partial [Anaerolineales bacterium]|nr:YitT family protein [Anaerolineales bacterium]
MVLIGNLPLFLLGWRFLGGRRFARRTAVAVITYSLFTDLLLFIPFFPENGLTDDILLNALYGAVVSGIGYGLVYRGQGTSGG